jgi:ADP-ribosyl-[dinitrogen reductase] hydrolase
MTMPATSDSTERLTVADRLRGSLWGMFVGDALAMPVHWYYDVAALQRDCGEVRDYRAPALHHPNSIMGRASTGQAGRGSQEGDVVGGVILKGKKALWSRPHTHYHHGLAAGDNTLNLLCARILIRNLTASGGHDPQAFLRDYIAFMTAPDSHRDTYAESYHRDFFANWARGVPPERCAGAEGHDTASIGGLVSLPPLILALRSDRDQARAALLAQLRLTHRSALLERHALELGELLLHLLDDPAPSLRSLAVESAGRLGSPIGDLVARAEDGRLSDLEVIGRVLSPACYIDQSYPAVLYLAARHAGDLEAALIANTNAGGDSCHRGAVLGAILGAALGCGAIPTRWIEGLRDREVLQQEIDVFIARFGGTRRSD